MLDAEFLNRLAHVDGPRAFRASKQQRKCDGLRIRVCKPVVIGVGKQQVAPRLRDDVQRRITVLQCVRDFLAQHQAQWRKQAGQGLGVLGNNRAPGKEVRQQRFEGNGVVRRYRGPTTFRNVAGQPDQSPDTLPFLVQRPLIPVAVDDVGRRLESLPLFLVMTFVVRGIRPLAWCFQLDIAREHLAGENGIVCPPQAAGELGFALRNDGPPKRFADGGNEVLKGSAQLVLRLAGRERLRLLCYIGCELLKRAVYLRFGLVHVAVLSQHFASELGWGLLTDS